MEKKQLLPTEDQKVLVVEEDDQAYFFQQASQCSRSQRLKALLFLCAAGLFCYSFVIPNLPSIPVELTPDGLRTPTANHHHHQGIKRPIWSGRPQPPCPHGESRRYLAGYMNNVDIAMKEVQDSSFDLNPSRLEKHFENIFLKVPSAKGAKETLRGLTNVTHVAGQKGDYDTAISVLEQWGKLLGAKLPKHSKDAVYDAGSAESIHLMTSTRKSRGEEHHHRGRHYVKDPRHHPLGEPQVWIDTYSIWLNYPVFSSLSLYKGDETEPLYKASLKEDVLDKDPSSDKGLPLFHGYSKSGKVKGQFIYAALCTKKDFDRLEELGISAKGKITICRYGNQFRGLKVRESAERGAVGTLIYTDPAEDTVRLTDGAEGTYPDGPARNPSSVQRGSVQAISIYPGDPSTPGAPSYRNATRLDPETADSLPAIPSLPISYRDVLPLLEALKGSGKEATEVGDNWKGAIPGLEEYWTGPSEDIVLELENQMTDYSEPKDIWNTYAKIAGVIEDEVVIISNHRDAWTFGAGDPSSGTAAIHELMAGLGALLKTGWRPLRTILVANWDAEEYGLVGSTEAAEDYADFFKEKAVIFLNMDVAVSGGEPSSSASPSLIDLIVNAAADVANPNGNGSVLHIKPPGPVGSGSDYTAYLQNLGIASVDMGFQGGAGDPVYHYHSNYDSFYWMEKYGDPGFTRHLAASQWLGLAALRSAQGLLLPVNIKTYSDALQYYLEKVEKIAPKELDLSQLSDAIASVRSQAQVFSEEREKVTEKIKRLLSYPGRASFRSRRSELSKLFTQIRSINKRVKSFETNFLSGDGKGLSKRPFYQHLVVAPGRNLGYGSTTFPGLTESITLDGGEGTKKELERLIEVLHKVAKGLTA